MSAQSPPGMNQSASGAQEIIRESHPDRPTIPQPKRGRPKGSSDTKRLAFAALIPKAKAVRRELGGGPPNQLERVTVQDLRDCLENIELLGKTPWVMVLRHLSIPPRTYYRWRHERDESETGVHSNPITEEFLRLIDKAWAGARGDAEGRVFVAAPESALTKGPLGRTTGPDRPGWTGDPPPLSGLNGVNTFHLNFTLLPTNNGAKTIPAEVVPDTPELGTGE